MPISVTCLECEKSLKVADTLAGKAFKCPGCKSVVKVPAASVPAPGPTRKSQPARGPSADDSPRKPSVPAKKPRQDEEEEEDVRPARKSRRDEDEDDYDDRPAKKTRRDLLDDDEDDRPRKKKPAPTERLEEIDEDLPVEELDLEQSELPDNIRERIEQELSKGEKLYWVGMPSRRIVLIRSIWAPIVGVIIFLFVFGFFVLPSMFMSRSAGEGLGIAIAAGGFAVLVGGSFCVTPLYNLWRAGRTCYALTSRRAIVWQAGIFGGVEMENYNPARLANMWRRDMWIFGNGGGDLVFRSVTIVTVTTGKHGGVSQNTTYYGFIAIENVRKVERLVREVLVDKVIDRLTS